MTNAPSHAILQLCILRLRSRVDETENVVEDIVATRAVGQELEGLGVAHRSLFLVDLVFESDVVHAKCDVSASMLLPKVCPTPGQEYRPARLMVERLDLRLRAGPWRTVDPVDISSASCLFCSRL